MPLPVQMSAYRVFVKSETSRTAGVPKGHDNAVQRQAAGILCRRGKPTGVKSARPDAMVLDA